MVLVLLLLLLGVLNLLNSLLVRKARESLEMSELGRAEAITREYVRRIGRPAFLAAGEPGATGRVTSGSLRIAARKSGLSRVRFLDPAGKVLVRSGPGYSPGRGPFKSLDPDDRAELEAGRTVRRVLDRAEFPERKILVVWKPLLDNQGQPAGIVEAVLPGGALADLAERAGNVIGVQITGILLIGILSVLFASWVSRPYRKLAAAAGEAGLGEVTGARPGDPEELSSLFRTVVSRMREQEKTIENLEERGRGMGDLVRFASRSADGMSTGVLVVDREGTIAGINDAASGLLGVRKEQAEGRRLASVLEPGDDLERVVGACVQEGKAATREVLEVRFLSGRRAHLGVSISPSSGSAGKISGALILMTDLTEIQELQDRTRLRENLASVGTLSAGIAHEFRNALGTILGYARLLEKSEEEEVRRPAREIRKEVDGVRKAVDEFLAYARPPRPSPAPTQIEPLIRSCAASAPDGLGTRITGEYGCIVADERLVRRVFDNLFRNAAEAGREKGGRIQVQVRGRRVADGAFLQVELEDNGPGIPEEELENLFVPFHTTRAKGTGLGLALVQRTMVDLGGSVEASRGGGGGALFRLRFPLLQGNSLSSVEIEQAGKV